MRQRKQKDVAKENEFYVQLLQQALPVEQQQTSNAQMQLQSQVTAASAEQNNSVKSQSQRHSNSQYNPSPEKSKGSLYSFQNSDEKWLKRFIFQI